MLVQVSKESVDARIVEETRTGKSTKGKDGNGIIDSQQDVGRMAGIEIERPAPADGDQDGMPDDWERSHGLNPQDASDATKASGNDPSYNNIESILNGLVEPIITIQKSKRMRTYLLMLAGLLFFSA